MRADLLQLFARLFRKQAQQFGIGSRDTHRAGCWRCRQYRRLAHTPGSVQINGDAGLVCIRGRDQHRARVVGDADRRHRRHHLLGLALEHFETHLRVIEHVPGVAAAGLESFNVVLKTDYRVGKPVEVDTRQRHAAWLHHPAQLAGYRLNDIYRARFAEHQQPGLDAAHQFLPGVEPCGIERTANALRYAFLHARQIDNAFAQHRALYQLEIFIGRCRFTFGWRLFRQDQADQLAIKMVFNLDQYRCDLHQRRFVGTLASGDHRVQTRVGFLNPSAQFTQSQHAQRVTNLAQQLDLRLELLDLTAAAAHEYIEHVLDPGQILADRRCDGVHELDGRRGKTFALLLNGVIDRQQFVETERGAHRRDARTRGARTRHVIQEIVEQLNRRQLRVARLAQFIEPANLPVGQPQQAFDRNTVVSAILSQCLEQGPNHPPKLKYALLRRHLLETRGNRGENLQILLQTFAAYPANQAGLKTRPQSARPLRGRERRLTRRRRSWLRLAVGLQIEQQQRAFGQQRATAHRAQIIQQRQQHQGQIAAAGEHAFEVARELHHGAHQGIERLRLIFALVL